MTQAGRTLMVVWCAVMATPFVIVVLASVVRWRQARHARNRYEALVAAVGERGARFVVGWSIASAFLTLVVLAIAKHI